jgi:hypothetical protein
MLGSIDIVDLAALETCELPPNYAAPTFNIRMDAGEFFEAGIVNTKHNVRVYYCDFGIRPQIRVAVHEV